MFGEVTVRADLVPFDRTIDLASIEIGGIAVMWSNKHYGHPRNLIAPGRGNCMGDGWETARQPKLVLVLYSVVLNIIDNKHFM